MWILEWPRWCGWPRTYPEQLYDINTQWIADRFEQYLIQLMTVPELCPSLSDDRFEDIWLEDEVVCLQLGDELFASPTTAVFEVVSPPDLVVKYQISYSGDDLFKMIRDAFFADFFSSKQISVGAIYVSPGVALGNQRSRKTPFPPSGDTDSNTVRFLVTQDAGSSLYQWVKAQDAQRLPVNVSVRIVLDLLDMLREMHSSGVVHGDIHPGNVMMNSPNGGNIRLIDFERTLLHHELVVKKSNRRFAHCLMSPWEMEGWAYSYRDDVFRALIVAAYLIGGTEWLSHCRAMEQNGDNPSMHEWMKQGSIFDIPNKFSLTVSDQVRSQLEDALQIAREPYHPLAIPRYDEISRTLNTILTVGLL
jgi:hypothetical protein